jgi:cytidine deaminase
MKMIAVPKSTWSKLAKAAWKVRSNARILEDTYVGAAVLTPNGKIFVGCNVEHSMRSHDIHAETNAISSMIAAGEKKIAAVLVVAKCSNLTPCGGCRDWINEFAAPGCVVGVQSEEGGKITTYAFADLLPNPPSK